MGTEAETHRANFASEESTAETEVDDAVKRRSSNEVRSKEKEPRQATEAAEPRPKSAEPEASAAILTNAALTLRRSFKRCIEI